MIGEEELESISPTLCLAKWLHLSLHLDRGTGHSCYHTPERRIPVEALQRNPASLHNTPEKKLERERMIGGERISGCEFCWRHEASKAGTPSDRVVKSTSPWAGPLFADIAGNPGGDFAPTYLEVGFSDTCQLRCAYCGPHNSSAWRREIEQYGDFTNRRFPEGFEESDAKQHVEAFWKWWPTLSERLSVLRITGGEPLLSSDTYRVLDALVSSPKPGLELIVNSNLSVKLEVFERFMERLRAVRAAKAVRKLKVITSLEAIGPAASYIRFGIDLDRFWASVKTLCLEDPSMEVSITSTVQALSVDSFVPFMNELLRFRRENKFQKLRFDPSPIVHPSFLRLEHLPRNLRERFSASLGAFLSDRLDDLAPEERLKLKGLQGLLNMNGLEEAASASRAELRRYFMAYDRIRGTSFASVFPGLRQLWELP